MTQQQFEKWLDIEEAESHTGYSRTTISRWLNDTDHPLDHLADGRGGKVMIACSTLDAYMHARAARNTAKRRVHFVSDAQGATPTLCGRIRDGILLSSKPDEVTCLVCREVLTPGEAPRSDLSEVERIVSGALFDFAGALTTAQPGFVVGASQEPREVRNLLQSWARRRGLSLDEPRVDDWSLDVGGS